MAIIRCPECRKKISDQAVSCPKCAYPISTLHNKPLAVPASNNVTPTQESTLQNNIKCFSCFKDVPSRGKRCGCGGMGVEMDLNYEKRLKNIKNQHRVIEQNKNKPAPPPEEPKKSKADKIPWFTLGMAWNHAQDMQLQKNKQNQEQAKQTSLMEEILKNLKK